MVVSIIHPMRPLGLRYESAVVDEPGSMGKLGHLEWRNWNLEQYSELPSVPP